MSLSDNLEPVVDFLLQDKNFPKLLKLIEMKLVSEGYSYVFIINRASRMGIVENTAFSETEEIGPMVAAFLRAKPEQLEPFVWGVNHAIKQRQRR